MSLSWGACPAQTLPDSPRFVRVGNSKGSRTSKPGLRPASPGLPATTPPKAAEPDVTNALEALQKGPGTDIRHWTFGLRLRNDDLRAARQTKLRPVIGLRWGRWRVGLGGGREWLREASLINEPAVVYDWFDSQRYEINLGARLHSLTTGKAYERSLRGRGTVRGRMTVKFHLDEHWDSGVIFGQDLLGRGDGSTVNLGLSRRWAFWSGTLVQTSVGVQWATAQHWRTAFNDTALSEQLGTGFGDIGVDLTIRRAISRDWGWFSTLGATRPVGDQLRVLRKRPNWNGEIGILYFLD